MTLYEFASKLAKSSNLLNIAAITKRCHSGTQTYTVRLMMLLQVLTARFSVVQTSDHSLQCANKNPQNK